jgi:hypothetical protein
MSALHVYCHVKHLNWKGLDIEELRVQSGKRINIRKMSCCQETLGVKGRRCEPLYLGSWAIE